VNLLDDVGSEKFDFFVRLRPVEHDLGCAAFGARVRAGAGFRVR
jgi:hypothetical protein